MPQCALVFCTGGGGGDGIAAAGNLRYFSRVAPRSPSNSPTLRVHAAKLPHRWRLGEQPLGYR